MDQFRYQGGEFDLSRYATGASDDERAQRKSLRKKTRDNLDELKAYQEKLYAHGKEGLIIILQATDAAGKDSTIKQVMGAFNPQGVKVHSFKAPNNEELARDYLWRAHKVVPRRGYVGIFNRSYYEDVLIVRVRSLHKGYRMAKRTLDEDIFERRYRQITNFEDYLYENSYRIVKLFLHLSKEEQKERFLDRIDRPDKNWKLSEADVRERAHWDQYQQAYEKMIAHTSTANNPWYIVPADNKWYTRYLVSEILLGVMREMDPQFPKLSGEEIDDILACRELLLAEKD